MEKPKETEITNGFKLEFLNQILSDTTGIKIITSKEQLISSGEMIPVYLPLKRNRKKTISHARFIADTLGVHDTLFVKKQMKANKTFDFNALTKYGFRVLNLEKKPDSVGIYDYTEKLNKGYDSFHRVMISKPIFNKELDKAYIMVDNFGGHTMILEKKNDQWGIKSIYNQYIE